MNQRVVRPRAGLDQERELWQAGYRAIAGLDEAGRGAWAGPVVAAAVILPPDPEALFPLLGRVDDSKRLSPAAREQAAELVRAHALALGVGSVPAVEIDRIGIVAATRLAMMQALAALSVAPDFLLLDYLTLPAVRQLQRPLVHGDSISLSIAAASVIAKVTRDHWMSGQEAAYAGYHFGQHKGYGTPEHQAALARLGPCPLHRFSFGPLAALATSRNGQSG